MEINHATRARVYLLEARQFAQREQRLTAEQAYLDALQEAYVQVADKDLGAIFVANARLAQLYDSSNRYLEARCCAHEALMLVSRTFDRTALLRNRPLLAAVSQLEAIYIGPTELSMESSSRSQHTYTNTQLRRLRVQHNQFPSVEHSIPVEVKCYEDSLTFRYHHDIIHESLAIPTNRTRKNRGGARRTKSKIVSEPN